MELVKQKRRKLGRQAFLQTFTSYAVMEKLSNVSEFNFFILRMGRTDSTTWSCR